MHASEEQMAAAVASVDEFIMNFCAGSVKLSDVMLGLGVETLCPTLCGQCDVVDVVIVRRTIGSAQCRIVEIVGPST